VTEEKTLLTIPQPAQFFWWWQRDDAQSWPALYPLALQGSGEEVEIITNGIEMGSISMLSFLIH
jgi:aromatic ring-opening dioxygenase catalytic subunit (LigB family)